MPVICFIHAISSHFLKMKLQYTIIIALLFSSASIYSLGMAQEVNDPVRSALNEYHKVCNDFRQRDNASTDEERAMYKEWKKRFQKVLEQYPNSESIDAARTQLLGLYNGLGESENSQKLLDTMIEAGTIEEKVRWYIEKGEVGKLSGQYQQSTLGDFEQAYTLFLTLPLDKRNTALGGRVVVGLCMAGYVAGQMDDRRKAANLYQAARELFQTSTEIAAWAVSISYDLEYIAAEEMLEWIHVNKEKNALNCLDILSKLPAYRWPPSHYALMYAELQYENNSKGFQDFVLKWLDEHKADERTPILRARLGMSYYNDSFFEKALPIYEVLWKKHKSDFQKLEPDAFRQGHSGHYDRVLSDLGVLYLRQGKFEDAERVKAEFIKLLPKSQNIKGLTPEHWSVDMATLSPMPEKPRYLLYRGTLVTLGLALILWGFYLHKASRQNEDEK